MLIARFKEQQYLKDKEKEEKMRERSPQPRHRLGASMGSAEPVSPRSSGASPLDPPSPRALPPHKSPGTVKKVQSIPRNSRRKSSEQISMSADTLQIEVNSVVLPATPIMSPQRKLSTQPRRLSRVNPKDVKRLYEGPTFGVPLAHQMFIGYDEFVIPPILQKTTAFLSDHLHLEGLFRVSGSQDELLAWKASFNDGRPVDFALLRASPHSVAGLLKAWLRELPEPLLTYAMFDQWMRIATKTIAADPAKALRQAKKRAAALPVINVAVLRELFRFLAKVVAQAAKNLMTAENVGVVIGPNILAMEHQDAVASAHVMPAAVTLTAFLVKNSSEIFVDEAIVPSPV